MLRREQKFEQDVSAEERHLGEHPTERRMSTLAPSSKKCSTSGSLLPEFARNLVLVRGSNLSRSTGRPMEALSASNSSKTVVSSAEFTLSWGVKLCDSVSLLVRKRIAPEGRRPSNTRRVAAIRWFPPQLR